MKIKEIEDRLYKKAIKSPCRFKISAIAISHKGEVLGVSRNSFQPVKLKEHLGIHAEMKLMSQYGRNIKTIFIMRTGNSGSILPIDPCEICKEKAKELGIKIMNIKDF